MANLWEVDDRLAPQFLARFYDRLASLPRAEALRQTQLDCLHGLPVGFVVSSPMHWAGYSLYGVANRVRFPAQMVKKLKRLWDGKGATNAKAFNVMCPGENTYGRNC